MTFHLQRSFSLILLLGTILFTEHSAAQDSAKPANDVTPRILRAYDVTDLVAPATPKAPAKPAVQRAPAKDVKKKVPFLGDIPLIGNLFRTKETKRSENGPQPVEALASFIRAFVKPGLDDGDIVKAVGTTALVIRGSQSHHDWVAALLSRNRRTKKRLMSIELRMLEMSQTVFRARIAPVLAAHARAARAGATGDPKARKRFAMLRDTPQTREFCKALRKADGINAMMAPRILVRRTSSARLWAGDKVAYVKDFDIEMAKDGSGSFIADPVVDVVHDGLLFDASCATLPNGKLGLDFVLVQSDLKRPIKTMKTKIGVRNHVTIQLPEVHLAKLATSVEFKDGDLALFALPPLEKKRVVAMIRLKAIDPEKPANFDGTNGEAKPKVRRKF